MNIGITLAYSQSGKTWNNGITQNSINLYLMLKQISEYNVFLVDPNYSEERNRIIEDEFNLYRLKDIVDTLNVIFIIGVEITDEQYIFLKNNNCKIIHYNCGSSYIVNMEVVLFNNKDDTSRIYRHIPDEVWVVPQNYETNKYYFQTLYKKEVRSVPFIWSSYFIDKYMKALNGLEYRYKPDNDAKRIVSFEPNLNIVKYSLYNVLIAEMVYNERKDLIKHMYITNAEKIKDSKLFIDTMMYLDIVKDGKASFEGRYATPYFLSTYTDIVISHQIYNPLNYAYLDALYLGYPLVHNADMIKDAGYYYSGFNAEMGKEKLLYALTEHDNNLEEYEEKSKKVLDRYNYKNEIIIETYKKLILNLFK